MNDNETNKEDMTDKEFLDANISAGALQVMSVYIEPDDETKIVVNTDEVQVMLRVYIAFMQTINSMPEVKKAIMTEMVEQQKQKNLDKLNKEREESDV